MTGEPLQIELVASGTAHRDFCELPFRLHRGNPCWVPPLRRTEYRRWDARYNPSLRTRRVWRFVARKGAQVIGRVAGVVDRRFAARWEPGSGFFGFFQCVDDAAVAGALLAAAETALQDQGLRRSIGPVDLTTHDEVGLLVDGFDSPPMILSPWNPPEYQRLLESAGYRPLREYHAFRWTAEGGHSPAVERLLRASTRARPDGIRMRCSDPRRWSAELADMHRLYNGAFADVWGFVPLTEDEFGARAAEFRQFYRPELVVFADEGSQPVGFGLVLPDINEALAPLRGRLWPLGWWSLMRALPRISGVRMILLGVLPGFRGRGIGALLAAALADRARRLGFRHAELSLVLDSNHETRHLVSAFRAVSAKTYRLYQRDL